MLIKYSTKTLSEIYPSADVFYTDFQSLFTLINAASYTITEAQIKSIYYLLYAQYGNNPIANQDEMQFKIKLWSAVYQYAPRYLKELEVQKNLLDLTEDEIATGAKTFFNHAFNPGGTTPSTSDMEAFDYINDQNVTNFKKGKLDAYMSLLDMLRDNFTQRFLEKFRFLFKIFVGKEYPIVFGTKDEEDEGQS